MVPLYYENIAIYLCKYAKNTMIIKIFLFRSWLTICSNIQIIESVFSFINIQYNN